jgi:uncharacterized protein YcbK (DUF882 family)
MCTSRPLSSNDSAISGRSGRVDQHLRPKHNSWPSSFTSIQNYRRFATSRGFGEVRHFYEVESIDQKALYLYQARRSFGVSRTPTDPRISRRVCVTTNGSFLFDELNVSDIQRGEYPTWAILKIRMLSGLEDWMTDYGLPLTINSGYRSPYVQNVINSSAPRDRHIHGGAADVNARTQAVWNALHDSALSAGGCVEPVSLSGISHLHSDWRQDDWRGICPATWKQ